MNEELNFHAWLEALWSDLAMLAWMEEQGIDWTDGIDWDV